MPATKTTTSKAETAKNDKKASPKEQADKKGSVKVPAKDAAKLKNPAKETAKAPAKSPAKAGAKAPAKETGKAQAKNAKPANKNAKNAKKTEAPAKPNRMAGVEKGDAANKGTAYINGTFNVNSAKKAMHSYISDSLGLELGTINAQYPYAAIAETLVLHVVRSSGKFNTKSAKKADLYEITLENVKRGIRESHEYGPEIKALVDSYNPTAMNYVNTFFDTDKVIRKFIETKAFTNSTNVHINNDALNFVCYILSHTMSNLTRASCILSQYANKKNVQIKNFRFACELYFTGELRELLAQRLSEIEGKFANTKEGADGEEGEEAEEEEEAPKAKKGAKGSKKATKDADEEEEAEEEAEEDAEEEEEEAEEEDEDEEDEDEDDE
ncbi:hypothetical protein YASMINEVIRUS_914 [Yasminevirus sp. GU-2018]|uniref:Uncharacterized protein n=1 Tax=Yasminevirus sp. GU-2018 TaxID=2420051 RepID=A0A5K0UA24_9VIRU|nr:hypothetical protein YASMINEVIRUS_914 [Yasminevirus sp. GU-2018]